MNARETILNKIAQIEQTEIQLPDLELTWNDGKNHLPEFIESLKNAGAEVIQVPGNEDIFDYVNENYPGTIQFDMADNWQKYGSGCSLSELNQLESVLIPGILAVAENGAIWVDQNCFPNRIIPFITQHLILKVNANDLLPTMDEAYRKISFDEISYGVFIAGPSKTADIEQSLVIGAHGPKAVTIIVKN